MSCTNTVWLGLSLMGPYTGKNKDMYHCPSDKYISNLQRNAGWTHRIRSMSMNSNWGRSTPFDSKAGNPDSWGYGPDFKQWHRTTDVSTPANRWVVTDEHPGSINDAFFVARPETGNWGDTPAFYHNKATSFSFADGHSEVHRWSSPDVPIKRNPDGTISYPTPPASRADGNWYNERSVDRKR